LNPILRRLASSGFLLALALALPVAARADTTPQGLPFWQDWSNASLILANDDWSTVPGVSGAYRAGLVSNDPRTILGEGTYIHVIANQANPNALATGGVAEFDGIANPVVALQGSSSADAPFLVICLNTTGLHDIWVSYNLRDIDGTTDNAEAPVALQFRVGDVGNFTNVPAGFVVDATQGSYQATLVTPVSAALPAAADDQALVQVRIITAHSTGPGEWIGIDDIVVTATSPPSPLSGVGMASPSTVAPGHTSLLTVTVTPASFPASTGIVVSCDMTAIGGSAVQPMFDDGTNGDVTPGDNVFSLQAVVAPATTAGPKTLPAIISDQQAHQSLASIGVIVEIPVPATRHSWGALKTRYR